MESDGARTVNKNPEISVCMPVFNGERYLRKAVESILGQTFVDFELLLIDDGSTDNSRSIMNSFTDPRIRILSNSRNFGLTATRNRGLQDSSGEYIALLDCDDIACPTRLAEQLSFLKNNPEFGMIGSWIEVIDSEGVVTGDIWKYDARPEFVSMHLLFHNYFAQSAVMLRRSSLPEELYRDFQPAEDFDLWVRIVTRALVWNLPRVLLQYRLHGSNITGRMSSLMEKSTLAIVAWQLEHLGITPTDRELDLHIELGKGFPVCSRETCAEAEEWCMKLLAANAETRRYPRDLFASFLAGLWAPFLTACSAGSFSVLTRYIHSMTAGNPAVTPGQKAHFYFEVLKRVSVSGT